MNILLVEADASRAAALQAELQGLGHAVAVAGSWAAADGWLAREGCDALVLEPLLPDGDNLERLERLRQQHRNLLILVLSRRKLLAYRLAALEAGADDYLHKPLDVAELDVRLRVAARRRPLPRQRLRWGTLELDTMARTAALAGVFLSLTDCEWNILELLVRQGGEAVSKAELLRCWHRGTRVVTDNATEVYVFRLRRKLEPELFIRTVRGYGYLLELPAGQAPAS